MYEPERCGAQCWRCPLHDMRDGPPVPPESNPHATIAIIGEAPGEHEVREGRPFVGPSGTEITQALHNVGILRGQLHIDNVLLCRPPNNKLSAVLAKIQKRNRDIKEENRHRLACGDAPLPLVPTPQECCTPRLFSSIQPYRHIIVAGSVASRALIGPTSIMDLRGGMITAYWHEGRLRLLEPGSEPPPGFPEVKILPTLHPSFVMRARRWTPVFRADLARAARWFNGAIEWEEPVIHYNPPIEFVEAFLSRPEQVWTYDTETDGIEPLTANLRTVQVGTKNEVLIVAYLGVDGSTHFYTPEQEQRLSRAFNKFFSTPGTLKFGWNNIAYDSHLIRRFFGVRDIPGHLDGILLHRLKESELPHNLGFVATYYTDAPQWKVDRAGKKRAYGSETDEELWLYGGRDVALTARVLDPLWAAVQVRGQAHLVKPDHQMAQVCAGMKENGMPVDQKRRLWWERMLTIGGTEKKKDGKEKKYIGMYTYLANLRELSGLPNLNPGSVTQLRDLLFERWKLESPLDIEERTTETGDPSTSDTVLRSFLTLPKLDPHHKDFILQLRRYRAVQKKLGTYVVKLRYQEQLAEEGFDDEEEERDREERLSRGDKKFGIVSSLTGRMYPGWNAHVAVTGRLSSSKPINAMNFPSSLKDIIAAPPGMLFVGADANQIDLRVAAARWGCELYLDAFRRGADPHAMTAYMVFGDRFKRAQGFAQGHWEGNLFIPAPDAKWGGESKALRDLSKRVCYACVRVGTRIVTFGPEGFKPIEQVVPGVDWTWVWSAERKRYEAAKITAKMNNGTRRCVRIRIRDDRERGLQKETVLDLTPDHLCMLRDGAFRAAGNLQPGDRLMPFRRWVTRTGYRVLDPTNTNTRNGEHRQVMGVDAKAQGHVHHLDRIRCNNNPENLEVERSMSAHSKRHWAEDREQKLESLRRSVPPDMHERLAAGRRRSAKWHGAVRQALQKRWSPENREATIHVLKAGKLRKPQVFASKLDKFRDKIGVLTDREVATLAGCTPENVGIYRKKYNIRRPYGQKGGYTDHVHALREKLGVLSDQEVAEIVGCHRKVVALVREELGILPAPRRPRQPSKLDHWEDRVGHEPDRKIAEEAGCTSENVASYRKTRGIPAYWREAKGGVNHTVLSVEDLGEHEVWDIEVDHEEHNFATEAGVFIHNSLYKGTAETVHKVLTETEIELDDGTTDLPYINLSLREVRSMHTNWLQNAVGFETGWEREIETWRRDGFLLDPVAGRRRDFLDGENPNEIVNFPIQAGAAGLINLAMLELVEQIPFFKWGPGTGVINQCHDAIVLEVPESEAESVAAVLTKCMGRIHPGLPGVEFFGEAAIGRTWKDV